VSLRVVLDTNAVVSALLFKQGRLSWLRSCWQGGHIKILASRATTQELIRVLGYPKFQLSRQDIEDLLADYLPYVETVQVISGAEDAPRCRDPKDQMFIDLAVAGNADVIVSGDEDLLAMRGSCDFAIETPADFHRRYHD